MSVPDYKINYKSDFVLNINGDAGWAVSFCIKFWTGMPSQAYFVGFDGVKYVNCRVGDTPTQLLVMFDDHHLPIGKLKMQIAYHTTIEEFPGSVFDEVTNARDVIVTIDGTDYQVMLDFTGEDAPELEFDLPAYANEAERIQNELQRQQNEADRIAAELQREQATTAAVQGAENVNAQLNGTTLTVTNRNGVSTSVNTKGEQGAQGPVGPEGPQGEQGVSIVSFLPKSETSTTLIYTITYSNGYTQDVAIPKGPKGDTGATGPTGPQGPQGVSVIGFTQTGETATNTMYNLVFSDGRTQSVAIPKGVKGDKGDTGNTGPQGAQGPKGDTVTATDYTLYNVQGSDSQGAMSQDATTKAISAQTGYYTCGTISGTAEKVVTVESGNVYKRTLGGHFKVKMTNKNTAASGVTLQIGSETAAALWYNGAAVSASNTWDDLEVISVYYDGTYYQASNAQGGGSGDGAFDISKYKTVAGVVPAYKTLAEALGTNGANVPENKRKGGMSVKYIQLTEATYNITKTEGIETQPTGTEVQEAISIADGDYSESDLSSIETLPTTLGSKVVYYLAVTEEIEVEPETEGGEPTIETVTTYTTWVIIKLSNESTEYVQWMLKSTAWSIVPSNWAGEEDVPKKSSLSTVTSGGFYNLYAPIVTVFERNVKNWAQNIPVILYPGIKYTITISKASSSLTVFSVRDYNGSGTNIINNVVLANRTIEYTPVNYIVSISLYSANVTASFRIQCDNAKKTLLTHSDVINNLSEGGTKVPLSAEMGKELNDKTFFLNYYYHPVSSGYFSDGSAHTYNINYCEAVLKNQDIASLSVKDGYEYRILGKSDNIRSSESFTQITSGYIRDKWVNTSSVAYLWIMIRKTDSSVIDCNELASILIVEYNGAKTQFNKIYTQDDVYRLGRREDLTVNYVNGTISIDYGTRTESESSTNFISEYIDVSKIAALSFVVSSKYSSGQFSPSLPVLWYDSNKNYIGHTNIQILIKDRRAIIGVPDAASYAVFSGKRTVEAIYRQDAVEAHYSISYKSVLGKLKKVSLIICHGQSLMIGADTKSSTVFPVRKRYPSLLQFSFTIGTEPQTQDNKYVGFATLETLYDRESPRLGLGEMFIQTIAKENNISVEANEWENHLMLMPSPARGGASIETLSSDEEYANVEAFIRNAKRFCDEYGYELDAPAWIWFQGENNLGSQTAKDTYKNALLALHERICGSLSTIAGITTRPKCIIYQPSSQCIQSTQAADYGYSNGKLGVPTAFAELLAENDEFLAAAPTYILTPATSGGIYIHCDEESYNLLGAYAGYALKKYLIDGINVKGVVPLSYTISGNTIKIKYNVPSPPLCVDTNWVREVAHYGYTCVKSDDTDIVTDVSIYWDTVTITCSESPVGCKLRYGLNGDRVYSADGYYGWSGRIYGGRGNIRDNQGNAIYKELPNGKILPMHNWAYCFEKVLE